MHTSYRSFRSKDRSPLAIAAVHYYEYEPETGTQTVVVSLARYRSNDPVPYTKEKGARIAGGRVESSLEKGTVLKQEDLERTFSYNQINSGDAWIYSLLTGGVCAMSMTTWNDIRPRLHDLLIDTQERMKFLRLKDVYPL